MKTSGIIAMVIAILTCINCAKDEDVKEESTGKNEDINLGAISEAIFTKSGNFTLIPKESEEIDGNYYSHSASQQFLFSVSTYSKFKISVQNFNGQLSLANTTTNEAITRQFRDPFLSFWGDEPYETELDEGDYVLKISGNSPELIWQIQIENINELKPYKDLGVLTLPYNEHFTFDVERERRTVYEFEIQEETNWKIWSVTDPYSRRKVVLLYDSSGEVLFSDGYLDRVEQDSDITLQPGRYKLSFYTEVNLVLGINESRNQDLGELNLLPFSNEFIVDLNYVPDGQQRIYFQTTTATKIGVNYTSFGSHKFSLFTADDTPVYINFWLKSNPDDMPELPAGSYYIQASQLYTPYRGEFGDRRDYTQFVSGNYRLDLISFE